VTRPGEPLPSTEDVNPASRGIDQLASRDVLGVIHTEDRRAWEAVGRALDELAPVVDRVAEALSTGGRLLYVGAGTSGRLGVLDASECPPTFGVEPGRVHGVIAGGEGALRAAIEGAEDSAADGEEALRAEAVGPADVVCGIAASGTTPFVHGALRAARRAGATTCLIHANARLSRALVEELAEHEVLLDTGPEIVSGSPGRSEKR